ncbi:MAG: hypothetical protein ACKO5F_01495 [Synechococcus sp.]
MAHFRREGRVFQQTLKELASFRCLVPALLVAGASGLAAGLIPVQAIPNPNPTLQPLVSCAPQRCSRSFGPPVPLGHGSVRGYTITRGGERGPSLQEMGVLITASALQGLPQNCVTDDPSPQARWLICQKPAAGTRGKGQMNDTMVTTLKMPPAALSLANVADLDVSWLPFGHAPAKVWDKPQFDIHFPLRNPKGGQSEPAFYAPQTPASQLPAGYMVLPGSGFHWDTVALQGHSHAADPKASPEFAGGPFLANFLYLNYNGRAIGYEVYASQSLLASRSTYTRALKAPQVSLGTSIVPTELTIRYEPLLSLYRVALTGFKSVSQGATAAPGHSH